jgi:hypothetical protein
MARTPNQHTTLEARARKTWRGPSTVRSDELSSPRVHSPDRPARSTPSTAECLVSAKVKRVCEAIYAKVLVDRAELVEPEVESFTAQTRAVWNALFGAR